MEINKIILGIIADEKEPEAMRITDLVVDANGYRAQ
jgi:hypothetical protein